MTTAVANAPTPATPVSETAASTQPEFYRLSVEQFEQMIDKNILTKYDKVELIEGLLVKKMTKNSPHIVATVMTQQALAGAIPGGWFLAQEIPVILARSEPEPEFLVLRGRIQEYVGRKPRPEQVALLVEVSDTSLSADRARAPLFAEAGIPFYWIVNIPDCKIEVFSDPAGNEYRTRKEYGLDDVLPLVVEGREVARLAVKDLLPPPLPS